MQTNYGFLLCAIFLFSIHFLIDANYAIGASDVLPTCNPIFTLGTLDKSEVEFGLDFRKIQKVEIDADGIVDPTKIPQRLIHPDGDYSPDRSDAAKELIINFKILDEESRLFLRIARSGDSDTLVIIDQMSEYRVTPEMLGSTERGKVGVYDLHLGTLDKGDHNILLTMPDDGLGFNGSYRWDAIILCKE